MAGAAAGSMGGQAMGGMFQMFGSLGAAKIASNAQKKIAKKMIAAMSRMHEEESAQRQQYSEMARADADIAQQNLLQSEQARFNILTSLGTPGSYGPSAGSTEGPISLGRLAPTGLAGLTGYTTDREGAITAGSGVLTRTGRVTGEDVKLTGTPYWKGVKNWEVQGIALDPTTMTAQIQQSPAFRAVSAMVAEAEQLMNREGPLWNELNNSVVGSVYQSNAAMQRQAMEDVARNIARGGTARRVGLQMAQAMQVQEGVNRQRTGALWQAKMNLETYKVQYAQNVLSFSQAWVNNHAGIRDTFTNALTALQMQWASSMAPALVGASVGAQSASQQGILQAGQGLYDAVQTSANAMQGAVQALGGIGQLAGSALQSWLTTPSATTTTGTTGFVGPSNAGGSNNALYMNP